MLMLSCLSVRAATITSIEISGLRRTKAYAARFQLEKFLGREGADLDLNDVYAAIKDTGLLEPLSAELAESDDGLVLRVTVYEKWAIFPAPVVMANSGGATFGFFLADLNAFGLMDLMAMGGMYGSSDWMAIAIYRHTPNRKRAPGWNGFFMYGRHDVEQTDRNKNIFRAFNKDELNLSFDLIYPFSEYISASLSAAFTNIVLNENDEDFNPPEKGAAFLEFTPKFSLRSCSWDGYLLSERSVSLEYGLNIDFSGFVFHRLELRANFEQSILPGFRFFVRNRSSWRSSTEDGLEGLFEDSPQQALVDILPGSFSARNYAGFSAGLEKYIFKVKWGTFSMLAGWQCAFSYGLISGFEFDNGPSAGVRFYLSRLAIPAFGGDIAYNINSGLFLFSFYLGMEF